MDACHVCSVVQSCPTLCQALLSKGFSRQGHWGGLPFPSPGDLPRPGTEPMSSVSLASAGRFFTNVPPVKPARISANLKKQGKGFPETWEQRHGVRISFTQGEGGLAVPVWIHHTCNSDNLKIFVQMLQITIDQTFPLILSSQQTWK